MDNVWIDRSDYVRLACEFASVANERFEGLNVYNGDYKINVVLVNASLSVELFFKSALAKRKFNFEIHKPESEGIEVEVVVHHSKLDQIHANRTHDLKDLFSRLPVEDTSKILESSVGNLKGIKSNADFFDFLDQAGRSFIDRRYPTKGVSLGNIEYLWAENLIALTAILERIYRK